MIKGILVINNHGKPRLTKFYEHLVSSAVPTPPLRRPSACSRPLMRSPARGCGQLRPHATAAP